jgi:hypothetical protein
LFNKNVEHIKNQKHIKNDILLKTTF